MLHSCSGTLSHLSVKKSQNNQLSSLLHGCGRGSGGGGVELADGDGQPLEPLHQLVHALLGAEKDPNNEGIVFVLRVDIYHVASSASTQSFPYEVKGRKELP